MEDPRVFGEVNKVHVGRTFTDRYECYLRGAHGVQQGGIHGTRGGGAYSVVLSGGYDDIDAGDHFVYTGSGGNPADEDSPRNPEQTEDQTFDNNNNQSLLISSQTKRPVRVIRGAYSAKNAKERRIQSPYAPSEGYRYDGLYIVDRAYMKQNGQFKVCAYDFRRVAGQKAIPMRARAVR